VHAVRSATLQVPRQVLPAQAGREPRGVPLTAVHTPTAPGSLQASHCPLQARLQQTPSAQTPLTHSGLVWQAAPFALRASQMALALQNWVAKQGAAALQPPEHRTESAHRLLAHGMVVACVQAPALLHTVAVVALPLLHEPATHWVDPPG
jgi:hypothetical protein